MPQPQRAKTLAPSPALNVPKRNIAEARYKRNRAVVSLRAGCSSEFNLIGLTTARQCSTVASRLKAWGLWVCEPYLHVSNAEGGRRSSEGGEVLALELTARSMFSR